MRRIAKSKLMLDHANVGQRSAVLEISHMMVDEARKRLYVVSLHNSFLACIADYDSRVSRVEYLVAIETLDADLPQNRRDLVVEDGRVHLLVLSKPSQHHVHKIELPMLAAGECVDWPRVQAERDQWRRLEYPDLFRDYAQLLHPSLKILVLPHDRLLLEFVESNEDHTMQLCLLKIGARPHADVTPFILPESAWQAADLYGLHYLPRARAVLVTTATSGAFVAPLARLYPQRYRFQKHATHSPDVQAIVELFLTMPVAGFFEMPPELVNTIVDLYLQE